MIPRGLFAIRGRAPVVLNNVLGMVPVARPPLPRLGFLMRFIYQPIALVQPQPNLIAQQLAAQQHAAELAEARRAAELERQRLEAQQRAAELAEARRLAELERQRLAELERQRLAREARQKRLQEIQQRVEIFQKNLAEHLGNFQKKAENIDKQAKKFMVEAIEGLNFSIPFPFVLEAELVGGGTIAIELQIAFPDCLRKNAKNIVDSIADAFSPKSLMKSFVESTMSSVQMDATFRENCVAAVNSTVEGFPETFVVAAVKGCNKTLGTILEQLASIKTKYEIAKNANKELQAKLDRDMEAYLQTHRLTNEQLQATIERQTIEEQTKRRLEQETETQRQLAEIELKKATEAAEAAKLSAIELERQKAELERQKAEWERQKAELERQKAESERIRQEALARLEQIKSQLAAGEERRRVLAAEWERLHGWGAVAENFERRRNAVVAFLDWLAGLPRMFYAEILTPLLDFIRRGLGLG